MKRAEFRIFSALFVLAVAGNLLPVWSVATLPMGDLGGHLELMDIAARYEDPATVYSQVYSLPGGTPHPNSISLYAARWAGRWLGVETVARLLVSFYVGGLALGALVLSSAFRRSAWLAFFAFPLAFNALMNVGFLNFLIALPLLLAAIGMARRFAEGGGLAAGAGLAALLVLIYFAHVFACLIALAVTATLLVLFARPRRLPVVLPALLLLGAWWFRMVLHPIATEAGARFVADTGLAPVFLPWSILVGQLYGWGMSFFRSGTDDVAFALLCLIWLGLLVAGPRGRSLEPQPLDPHPLLLSRLRDRSLEALTLGFAAAYFVLPSHIHAVHVITERLVVLTLCLLLAWPRADTKDAPARALIALLVGVALVYPFFVASEFRRFERTQVGDLRAAIADLPDRSRLAYVRWDDTNPITFMGPTWHLPKAFHALENGGLTDDSFAMRPTSPIQYRAGRTPRPLSPDFLSRADYLSWDFLLLRSVRRPEAVLAAPTLRLRFHQGSWWLFDVGRPVPTSGPRASDGATRVNRSWKPRRRIAARVECSRRGPIGARIPRWNTGARARGDPMAKFSEIPWIKQHIELYRTDPQKAHMWDSTALGGPGLLPTLLLTTTGRKSGQPRSLPLIYGEAGGSYVVVASKGGVPNHPVWYLNLEAHPECELMVGPKRVEARARTAQGEERERLWKQMAKLYPPYDEYQERAGARTIPVVVLDPVG